MDTSVNAVPASPAAEEPKKLVSGNLEVFLEAVKRIEGAEADDIDARNDLLHAIRHELGLKAWAKIWCQLALDGWESCLADEFVMDVKMDFYDIDELERKVKTIATKVIYFFDDGSAIEIANDEVETYCDPHCFPPKIPQISN